jgi:hypothetical protein
MKKIIISLTCGVAVLCGCVMERPLDFANFQTGDTLHGTAYRSGRKIEVTMPDGEVLVGKWSSIRNQSVSMGFGSATAVGGGTTATAFGNNESYTTGGPGNVFAMLKSTTPGSKLMMEFSATFDSLSGHGYGQARTNDGKDWKVTF